MKLDDFTAENYFKKVTYASNIKPGKKLVIPDADFINNAMILLLIQKLEQIRLK